MKPAWSWQFEAGKLAPATTLPLPSPITADWAWGGSRGAGVRVAVVDSGIDAAHPAVGAVAGGVVLTYDPAAPDQVRAVEGPHEDLFGHGTACAGIIRSLAPEAELHSVRVLGSRLTGKGIVFAAGLRWAIANRMQVVNLSLSTGRREYFAVFHELVDEAYFANVMLVCAVNNVAGPTYPSQYASVFSVAANEATDPYRFDYNPTPPVEFGAPGIDIEVPWLGGSTIKATGNSFAAPHIAGLVARILGKHPGLTPFQVKTVLLALASNAAPLGAPMATVTFFFADQAGSTVQLERLGEAGAKGVRQALIDMLRQAAEDHSGEVVDHTGDGLMITFASAVDAVACGVAVQQQAARHNGRHPEAEALGVRVGIHTGEPLVNDEGRWFGVPVVIAARLCAAADTGQVLVSDVTRALVAPRRAHRFTPLGERALKGIAEPVPVAAVDWAPEETERPLPEVLAAATAGPFVGRAAELAWLEGLWEQAAGATTPA